MSTRHEILARMIEARARHVVLYGTFARQVLRPVAASCFAQLWWRASIVPYDPQHLLTYTP